MDKFLGGSAPEEGTGTTIISLVELLATGTALVTLEADINFGYALPKFPHSHR